MQRRFRRILTIANKGTINAVHGRTAVHSHDCDVQSTISDTTARTVDVSRAVGFSKFN